MLTLRPRWTASIGSTLTVLLFSLAWWLVLPWVAKTWQHMIRFTMDVLGLPGDVVIQHLVSRVGFSIDVPQLAVPSQEPSNMQWWVGIIVCIVGLLVSWLLPRRYLPASYFLRLLVILQASSQFVFRVFPGSFPHDIASLTVVLFAAGFFLIALVPWIFGLTFFVLDFALSKKIAITVFTMAHLFVFLPLQYCAHAFLIHHYSLLWMPMLFWTFGLAVDVAIVIAFYSWAVSWQPLPYLRMRYGEFQVQRATPAVMALIALVAFASVARAERDQSIEVGAGLSEYTENLGGGNDQFVAWSTMRRSVDRLRLDVGHSERFEDDGIGLGLLYEREIARRLGLSLGVSTGTGDVIFPDLRLDIGVRRDDFLGTAAILRLGFTHFDYKSANTSDGGELGIFWPLNHRWGVSVSERIDIGQPGDTFSNSTNLGVRWGKWRRYYLGSSVHFGETSYVLLAPGQPQIDFSSWSWDVSGTWYQREDRGVSLRFEIFESDVYDLWGLSARVFREW
jgi:YaiO family outer membrane protein